ncbi:GATA zinc finger domain-containing protein 15-like [Diabrotica virgifera virgifera]|uniref:GATA zinc finger domain-containing protein 14-like n=1 Tax=Diabrotica virgifera virgifera TaxID=50390 RepID=A0ABM5KRN6_DIAVI|nr:GATA zinc finger domain-containing protein 15-like [Diabrotica virgifera virgifera]
MPFLNADITSLCATLPEFSTGDNLSTFLKSVDNLITFLVGQQLTASQEFILNSNIIARIKGEPRDFLNYSNKTAWAEVRPALLAKYGDRRSEDILVTQLSTTVQKNHESYDQYHQRITKNLNDLLQHTTLNDNVETANFKTPYFKNIALKTFCTGINEPYAEYLSHFTITSLEQALQKCIVYDNHKSQQKYMNYLKTQQNNKPFSPKQKPANTNQTFFNNNPNPTRNVFQPNSNSYPRQPNFNSFQRQPNFNSNPRQNFSQTNSNLASRNNAHQSTNFATRPNTNATPNSNFNSFRNNPQNNNNFNRQIRNPQPEKYHATPMTEVQTLATRNEPMDLDASTIRRTHNFNINANSDENFEYAPEYFEVTDDDYPQELVEETSQDFLEDPTDEDPPPISI